LSLYADTDTGECRPGHKLLAQALRSSERYVRKHLAIGERLGWLRTVKHGWGARDGSRSATVYQLTLPTTTGAAAPLLDENRRHGEGEPPAPGGEPPAQNGRTTGTAVPPNSQELSRTLRTQNEKNAQNEEPGYNQPVDALKRRCLEHFATKKNVDPDDCRRVVDQLRAENIADDVIDMALGQSENANAVRLAYLVRVARDWYAQRGGRT
jgi:hypothetical protein